MKTPFTQSATIMSASKILCTRCPCSTPNFNVAQAFYCYESRPLTHAISSSKDDFSARPQEVSQGSLHPPVDPCSALQQAVRTILNETIPHTNPSRDTGKNRSTSIDVIPQERNNSTARPHPRRKKVGAKHRLHHQCRPLLKEESGIVKSNESHK